MQYETLTDLLNNEAAAYDYFYALSPEMQTQLQQRRDLSVLHARDRVEQHNAPFLVSESCQCALQQRALVGVQSALLRGNGVPFLLAEGGMAFLPPHAHQAQVAAHGQQPAHG